MSVEELSLPKNTSMLLLSDLVIIETITLPQANDEQLAPSNNEMMVTWSDPIVSETIELPQNENKNDLYYSEGDIKRYDYECFSKLIF